MNPALLATLAQAFTRQQQAGDARRQARNQIAVDHAARLGYPMHGVRAQAASQAADDLEGTNYLQDLLPLLQKQKRGNAGR